MMRILIKNILNKTGEEVCLKGWVNGRRDHGKIIFIDLRDLSGVIQLVFTPACKDYSLAEKLRLEWVIGVKGKVILRPQSMINENIDTGKIEVSVEELEVITEAQTLPFVLDTDGREIGEDLRLKYRYLDLRRKRMSDNLRNRCHIIKHMRDFLTEKGFTEIETPMLTKSTPEGARDYLVPSRIHCGKFYSLPQSPQQYKQLLMVAGLERYFQIARCLRDEDPRGDRQPEFTQLDIEMSFVEENDILDLVEELHIALVKKLYPGKEIKLDENNRIPRMSYQEVMKKYNTDKPDIRKNKNNSDELAFLYVVDFPMFEWKEGDKRWGANHHPFTQPKVKDEHDFKRLFEENPSQILAKQYDFVLNGYEIGGGSIRTHNPYLLKSIFEVLGNNPADIESKFGHMFEAFKYGVPPHGGIACGIDRIAMILQNEPSIREVIAFPKTGDGRDLMMDSPSDVDEKQLKELGISIVKKIKTINKNNK